MKKTVLKNIAYPKVSNHFENTYIGVAERKIVEHKSTLVLHVFKKEDQVYKPFLQMFGNKEEFLTVMQDGKISKKQLTDILPIGQFVIVQGEHVLKEYVSSYFKNFTVNTENWSIKQFIMSYQATVKRKNLAKIKYKKAKKEQEEVHTEMKLFRKIKISAYSKKVRNIAFKDVTYLFYNKEERKGYCNVCQKEVSLDTMTLKHNAETSCPSCKKKVTLKDVRRGRKNMKYIRWSVKVERVGEKLITRYFSHFWDLSKDYRNSNIETKEKIRSVFHENKTFSDYSYEYEEYTETHEWKYYKEIRGFMGQAPSEYVRPRNVYLYNSISNLKTMVKNTAYKYSGLPEFLAGYMDKQYMTTPYMVDHYLNSWVKKPYFEKFSKVGFSNLVIDMMNEFYSSFSIKKEGTLPDMLGVSKEHFKWLLEKTNPIHTDVKILQQYPNLSKKDYFTLVSYPDYISNYDAYMECKKYTTLHKIGKYLVLQNRDARYYRDYLEMSEGLGYDLKNSFNLFPKNLTERHDERVAEKRLKKEKLEQERLDAFNKELQKFMEQNKKALENETLTDVQSSKFLKIGDLFIRLPYTTDEIKQEGEALHHCVGGYVDKVINGNTEIFFIRKVSAPETPFYTLEWRDNEIKQCYGMRNCSTTPEVEAFANTFAELMNQKQVA